MSLTTDGKFNHELVALRIEWNRMESFLFTFEALLLFAKSSLYDEAGGVQFISPSGVLRVPVKHGYRLIVLTDRYTVPVYYAFYDRRNEGPTSSLSAFVARKRIAA